MRFFFLIITKERKEGECTGRPQNKAKKSNKGATSRMACIRTVYTLRSRDVTLRNAITHKFFRVTNFMHVWTLLGAYMYMYFF